MTNTTGRMYKYMIYIGDIELGFNINIDYAKGRYDYLFCINNEDKIRYDKWVEGLEERPN